MACGSPESDEIRLDHGLSPCINCCTPRSNTMKRLPFLVGIVICAGLTLGQNSVPPSRALIDQYCVTCHNQKTRTAGLMLDKMDPAHVGQDAEAWEKVVRKLRAGMMPPQGMPRPNAATYETLTVALETELDRAAGAKPKLAMPGVHRM